VTTFPTPIDGRFEDMIVRLQQRVQTLESQVAAAAGAFAMQSVTSATHPANPVVGAQILESDTGLTAYWSGSAWVYPPKLIYSTAVSSGSSVRLPASGSIPQVFDNLRLIATVKSSGTTAGSLDPVTLQFNASSSGYNWNSIQLTQGSATPTGTSGASVSASQFMQSWNNLHTSPGRGVAVVDIPDYADAANDKSFTSLCSASDGGTAGGMQYYTGTLNGVTAAVSSLTVAIGVGQFTAATFYLYGY
jgi:hypothetical protein